MYTAEDISLLKEEFALKYYQVPKKTHRQSLYEKYQDKLVVNPRLNRALISFQANKEEPLYRWFKYKEGFSFNFVKYILDLFGTPFSGQTVLDPFAGISTTLTTSIYNGYDAIGIELLSPGILATKARLASSKVRIDIFRDFIRKIETLNFSDTRIDKAYFFKHLTITAGAFPQETEVAIACMNRFIAEEVKDQGLKSLLKFAVNSILEDVSFTRKDGQYLRWDYRSERKLKSKFNKGTILNFRNHLLEKLNTMLDDISGQPKSKTKNNIELINGSCLHELHRIESDSIDLVITSPPYCNRYDYTRTYALELAYNGVDNQKIKELRQTLLSATVENKSKYLELQKFYKSLDKTDVFDSVVETFRNQLAMNEAIASLYLHKNELNNKNIPDMVSNYFFEMNFVIWELERILNPGGKIIMVNDNVKYNGDEIPVDLILSEFASLAGLNTDVIWVLERGKGNSSQQMGIHGRQELRKCVYVWSK